MIIQWFLRGVADGEEILDDDWAKKVLNVFGLRSAWLRWNSASDPAQWDEAVNHPDALLWHITRFDDTNFPLWPDKRYSERSPFLSLSSGTVEPDHRAGLNRKYPAWYTALSFATANWRRDGWVFHGYASVLGRPALPLLEFSEEVRDLHQHDFYSRYHPEGEVVAKVLVPPVRLKQAFRVSVNLVWDWFDALENSPDWGSETELLEFLAQVSDLVISGDAYRAPEQFSNVRDLI